MRKNLSWWDLIWFGIGAIIGAGIFVLTGQEVNQDVGSVVVLSCVVSGLSAMLSVLCYTEFAIEILVAGSVFWPTCSRKRRKAEKHLPSKEGATGVKKAKKNTETYQIYIFKVHPDIGISSKAMGIMNSIDDIFEKLAQDVFLLACCSERPIITSREIQTSIRLDLLGELAKHAISKGTRAKFASS